MKNIKPVVLALSALMTLSACGGADNRKETTQKIVETIVKDPNYERSFEFVKYASHTDSKVGFTADTFFQASEDELDRFDVLMDGFTTDYNYYGKLDVIITDSYTPEGVFQIKNSPSSEAYFTAQFTLTEDYVIGGEKYRLDFHNENTRYVTFLNGIKALTTALGYSMNDLKDFMSKNDLDIKTYLPNAY